MLFYKESKVKIVSILMVTSFVLILEALRLWCAIIPQIQNVHIDEPQSFSYLLFASTGYYHALV